VNVSEKLTLQLLTNADSTRLGLPTGIYSVQPTVVAIAMTLVTRCAPGDRSSTPVEPFGAAAVLEEVRLPLTTLGNLRMFREDQRECLSIETTPYVIAVLFSFYLQLQLALV